ncbi:hypothetical protein KGQ24_01520 [Patescibacteria group bacterium]|nr:hypothetical protein [Patescibacteria group bacterium]
MPSTTTCLDVGKTTGAAVAEAARSARQVSRALIAIDAYPFSQVREKILVEEALPEGRVDEVIAEFRRFLKLIAMGHRGIGMISRDVDEVWHTFILFTRDYAEFCEEVFGFFLHHQPNLPSQPLGNESSVLFADAYRTEFGAIPAIWGIKDGAQCFSTCDTPTTNCQDPKCK